MYWWCGFHRKAWNWPSLWLHVHQLSLSLLSGTLPSWSIWVAVSLLYAHQLYTLLEVSSFTPSNQQGDFTNICTSFTEIYSGVIFFFILLNYIHTHTYNVRISFIFRLCLNSIYILIFLFFIIATAVSSNTSNSPTQLTLLTALLRYGESVSCSVMSDFLWPYGL